MRLLTSDRLFDGCWWGRDSGTAVRGFFSDEKAWSLYTGLDICYCRMCTWYGACFHDGVWNTNGGE